ncbi:hypothetical protein NDU88_005035 [Pleurodeles waltl]|uniref:Uncharacterized protein n=1 Tax=Pleurodeles waltl TaxID=8319 RepID=A0AAV7TT47_PLEWA|nr:hypothetical protein NDU88_005035 [Pleurodeles waltl]
MFDNFSVARLSHCVTSGPRKNYQTFTARHSGAARCRLIHGPAPCIAAANEELPAEGPYCLTRPLSLLTCYLTSCSCLLCMAALADNQKFEEGL